MSSMLHRAGRLMLAVMGLLAACAPAGGMPPAAPSADPADCKIAFLLPETKTARYETQDLPNFRQRLAELGFDTANHLIYSNAHQDAAAQQQQAEAALTNGARVLVLDPVDSNAAAKIADLAHSQNVPVISYDRLINGSTGVSYYISFDNELVGQLQATALLAAIKPAAPGQLPVIVMINGSPTDNNASEFKRGAHRVLDGQVDIAKEYDTPDWSPDKAQQQMEQALTALNNRVDGVYAANDGTGGGAIAAMKAAGLRPLPPVTGQDAELAAIQRILIGEQYMTVYKAIRPEARVAAELAQALCRGERPVGGRFAQTVNNGVIDVPSVLLTPIAVTRNNVKQTVVDDGFWTVAQICTAEYEAACRATGLK